jgi:hypothetical protein
MAQIVRLEWRPYRRRVDALTAGEPRLSVRYHMVPGEPSPAVLDFAGQNNEDLILMGLDNFVLSMVVRPYRTLMKSCDKPSARF